MVTVTLQSFWMNSGSVSATISGTITPTSTANDIKAGGKTIVITLSGDTWIAAGPASFDLQRSNIINGITSAVNPTLGWNNVVKVLQSVSGVVRTSDTVVTITLDAFPTYLTTISEVITVTVPATALTGAVAIVGTPTFTVNPSVRIVIQNLMFMGVG